VLLPGALGGGIFLYRWRPVAKCLLRTHQALVDCESEAIVGGASDSAGTRPRNNE